MKFFFINHTNINFIDKYFKFKNINILNKEIKKIIDNFWIDTGKYKQNYAILLTSDLKSRWLTRFYIYYFSLKNISSKYEKIFLKDTNYALSLFKDEFNLNFKKNTRDHSDRFFGEPEIYPKGFKRLIFKLIFIKENFFMKDIIYLNAGKLDKDFKELNNSINAKLIPIKSFKYNQNVSKKLKKQILKNIRRVKISLPKHLLIKFIEDKILYNLEYLLNYIDTMVQYINKKKIKLCIISTTWNDKHLALLIASKITGIKCLITSHGLSSKKNYSLDCENFLNAKISKFEYNYKNSKNFKFKPKWLHEKI